jgi:hypothetical protein
MNVEALRLDWMKRNGYHVVGLAIGVVLSIAVYLVRSSVDPRRGFVEQMLPGRRPTYRLYTGPDRGRFNELAGCVDSSRADGDSPASFTLERHRTNGSLENGQLIASSSRAFAFVGETFKSSAFVQSHRSGPLYMQKAQLFYKPEDWKRFAETCESSARVRPAQPEVAPSSSSPLPLPRRLEVSLTHHDACARRYLENANWFAGPVGSGTWLMAQQLAGFLDIDPRKTPTSNLSLERMYSTEASVMFIFSGQLSEVTEALTRKNFALEIARIAPNVAQAFTKDLGLDITSTFFADPYPSDLETIGSWAWLVASSDIPAAHIAEMLRRVARCLSAEPEKSNLETVAEGYERTAAEERRLVWGALGEQLGIVTTLMLLFYYAIPRVASQRERLKQQRRLDALQDELSTLDEATSTNPELAALTRIRKSISEIARDIRATSGPGTVLCIAHRQELRDAIASVRETLSRKVSHRLGAEANRVDDGEVDAELREWIKEGYVDPALIAAYRGRRP